MLQTEQLLQGRYRLDKLLGNNAGRQTWVAVDTGRVPTELVVVKLLAFSPQMQWEEFKLFEREAQVLKQLNHPRIPQYRDYFSLDKEMGEGLCWFGLVQDYIPGTCLRQLLGEGQRFTESEVRNIATDILDILTYLHELSPPVLHRDIKPSNLILGENKQVYLVDFGAVQNQAAVEGVTFTVVGTTGYAPLEQFWGRTVPASDLYALGATLIHLLTGTAPADLPQQDLRIQFADRVSIDPNFIRWIEVLTEPELKARFSRAREALEALTTGRYLTSVSSRIPQPVRSDIRLSKSRNQLKIELKRHNKISLALIFLALKLPVLILSLFLTMAIVGLIIWLIISSLASMKVADFSLLIFIGIAAILGWCFCSASISLANNLIRGIFEFRRALFRAFGRQYVCWNRDKFDKGWRLFSWCDSQYQCQTAKINTIHATPSKLVIIEDGGKNYSFGQNLTFSEREWLVQEIQDWLKYRE
ncbi:MAG: serine/threonine-protein kinase [Potamolinea sp.]